jgi:hypothetical protein
MVGVGTTGPAIVLVVALWGPDAAKQRGPDYLMIGLGLSFLLVGGGMAIWASLRRVRVGADGITSRSTLGGFKTLTWDAIEKVAFSGYEFWIYGRAHNRVMLLIWDVGMNDAVTMLESNLPESVRTTHRDDLNRLAKLTGAQS